MEKDERNRDDEDSIPLADDDPLAVIEDDTSDLEAANQMAEWQRSVACESLDSIPSMISDIAGSGPSSLMSMEGAASQLSKLGLDTDFSPYEAEEKAKLIAQVLELQNTLDDLTNRVDAVKEENLKLRSENSVLGQYIENLMQASAVFQAVSPKSGRRQQNHLSNVIRTTARAVRGASSVTPSPSSTLSTPTLPLTASSSSPAPVAK